MKNRIIILLSIGSIFFILLFPSLIFAKSGCCSWHGGVAGCSSSGRQICNDGTLSPSCTCYAPKNTSKSNIPSKTSTKDITETESVPYQKLRQNDPNLLEGQTRLQAGANGSKSVIYTVTYSGLLETSRVKKSERITQQPVNQISYIGTKKDYSGYYIWGIIITTYLGYAGYSAIKK